jgi:5-formyltetrahydrofolate cyclo-ligase
MWRVDSEEKKLVLRGAVLARRNSLTRQECVFLSRDIQSRALKLPPYKVARTVALYSATQNEVFTEDILEHALASGRRVFYPRITAEGAGEFIRLTSSAELRAGRYGIREPGGTERLSVGDCPALTIFVPGVAFDRMGNRLGRGKGWYDRILGQWEDRATIVALAYQFQIVEQVPVRPWDRKVQYIVTENELIDCEGSSGAVRPQSQLKGRGCFN